MDDGMDTIIDDCITQLIAGEATVQDCLIEHCAVSRELEPLLRVAEQLASVPAASPSPEARARMQRAPRPSRTKEL